MRFIAISTVIVLLSGCYGNLEAVKKDAVLPLVTRAAEAKALFTKQQSTDLEIDVGGMLFQTQTVVLGRTMAGVRPMDLEAEFPTDGWTSSWTYMGADAPNTDIYTNPNFYDGDLGVIIDGAGRMLTAHPVIQIAGAKRGRRWAVSGGPVFFVTRSWGLRYGGLRDNAHRLLIVDNPSDKEREIVQDFQIGQDEASHGFSVKGVRVRILSYEGGRIRYQFASEITE